MTDDFLDPRQCLLDPIPEIWVAAGCLFEAVEAHLSGDRVLADSLIRKANDAAVASWTDSIWGVTQDHIVRYREIEGSPPYIQKDNRPQPRMPGSAIKKRVKERDGHFCKFCGIPVIERSIRIKIRDVYPDALQWGRTNETQHAAFQCMWLQYDHVLPNSRGGESTFENIIVTCAPCNFGRMERTIEEVGLLDPRLRDADVNWKYADKWQGLENFKA